jgi:stage III sporulation protein AF
VDWEKMNQVTEWLRQLVAAIILAGLLEMLLPNNELKNVTKMVMGLLIMMILIQPLIKVFDLPQKVNWSLPSLAAPKTSPPTERIIAKGLKIRESWTKEFQRQNQALLEEKLKNIIGLIDEVQLKAIKVDFQDDKPFKAVLKLKLLDPVPSAPGNITVIRRKVVNAVQLLTNLSPDKIEVSWNG